MIDLNSKKKDMSSEGTQAENHDDVHREMVRPEAHYDAPHLDSPHYDQGYNDIGHQDFTGGGHSDTAHFDREHLDGTQPGPDNISTKILNKDKPDKNSLTTHFLDNLESALVIFEQQIHRYTDNQVQNFSQENKKIFDSLIQRVTILEDRINRLEFQSKRSVRD